MEAEITSLRTLLQEIWEICEDQDSIVIETESVIGSPEEFLAKSDKINQNVDSFTTFHLRKQRRISDRGLQPWTSSSPHIHRREAASP